MKCRLLFNEEPIVINRLSAKVLGLNEAIVVQQIHYWLNINEKAKKNFYDGRHWTFNTYEEWQQGNFDFWSISTIKRIFKKLFQEGILIKGRFNKKKYDQTLWVSIDYDRLEEILVAYENNKKAPVAKVVDVCLDDKVFNPEVTSFTKNLYNEITTDHPQLQQNVEISTEGQSDIMSDCNIVSDWNSYECQVDTHKKVNLTPPIQEITENTKEISFTTQFDTKVSVVDIEIQPIDTNKELIENKTHLLLDSKNKRDKVSKWNKDRLVKSIEIFKGEGGQYFSLLEKIYKDDKNFAPKATNRSKLKGGIGYCSMIIGDKEMFQYEEDEFNRMVEEKQKYR